LKTGISTSLTFRMTITTNLLRNMLHRHNGVIPDKGVTLSEVGRPSGVEATDWSWSALITDFDNDGNKDLSVAKWVSTGHPRSGLSPVPKRFQNFIHGLRSLILFLVLMRLTTCLPICAPWITPFSQAIL